MGEEWVHCLCLCVLWGLVSLPAPHRPQNMVIGWTRSAEDRCQKKGHSCCLQGSPPTHSPDMTGMSTLSGMMRHRWLNSRRTENVLLRGHSKRSVVRGAAGTACIARGGYTVMKAARRSTACRACRLHVWKRPANRAGRAWCQAAGGQHPLLLGRGVVAQLDELLPEAGVFLCKEVGMHMWVAMRRATARNAHLPALADMPCPVSAACMGA